MYAQPERVPYQHRQMHQLCMCSPKSWLHTQCIVEAGAIEVLPLAGPAAAPELSCAGVCELSCAGVCG